MISSGETNGTFHLRVENEEKNGMAKIGWLKTEDMPRWNAFVHNHPLGSIYHSSGWKDTLENSFQHIKGHFLALEDDRSGDILGGLAVYTVRSWLLGNKLVSVPFAAACDPLLSSPSDMHLLFPHMVKLYEQTCARAMEFRTLRGKNVIDDLGLKASSSYKHHYIELKQSADDLRNQFSKTAVRQMIVKAERAGIMVERRQSRGDLEIFYRLLTHTRKRLGLPQIPYVFFESLWANFGSSQLVLLLASTEREKAVGGLIGLVSRNTFVFEYSADTVWARQQGVGQLLCWRAIKLARESGYDVFSFGRTSSLNKGLLTHKRRWATKEEDLLVFSYSKSRFKLNPGAGIGVGYGLIRQISKSAPEALYKLIGDFYYRHWA